MINPMAPIIPQASVSDLQGVVALLALIADPAAAQKRLEELQAAASASQQLLAEIRTAQAEHASAKDEAAVAIQQAETAKQQAAAQQKQVDDLRAYYEERIAKIKSLASLVV